MHQSTRLSVVDNRFLFFFFERRHYFICNCNDFSVKSSTLYSHLSRWRIRSLGKVSTSQTVEISTPITKFISIFQPCHPHLLVWENGKTRISVPEGIQAARLHPSQIILRHCNIVPEICRRLREYKFRLSSSSGISHRLWEFINFPTYSKACSTRSLYLFSRIKVGTIPEVTW